MGELFQQNCFSLKQVAAILNCLFDHTVNFNEWMNIQPLGIELLYVKSYREHQGCSSSMRLINYGQVALGVLSLHTHDSLNMFDYLYRSPAKLEYI
ncbi:hypothetical protein IQ260_03100 [Leptolyngbya cf. ectocarpi LEGE 11479]|uniref:Uncharacterized protein n=1 Tax=Leptolyngbya cf. ectocarpi LEGE 11479 TaxID=1828722 RepID=A0A928WYA2_LEPEC|nr:hypothetical protein [Leptolyngbya ectocarpi]MBE9065634.1 hypothetical protein [Leptolyngbya cf. ectocarpi LEGE 11479]